MPIAELNSVVAMAFGFFGAWLFATAALDKATDFQRFAATLGAYQLAPSATTGALAVSIVALEVIAAVMLLLVFLAPLIAPTFVSYLALQWLALLAPLLLLAYAGAMAVNLLRGRRSIDCGCGGTPMPLSNALVARNLLLGLALICALLIGPIDGQAQGAQSLTQPLTQTSSVGWMLLLVVGFSLGLHFVYLIVNQLLANRALHAQLWVQQR